jgi:hypothetical protein
MRRWYSSLADSEKRRVRAMLSTYTICVCVSPSTLRRGVGRLDGRPASRAGVSRWWAGLSEVTGPIKPCPMQESEESRAAYVVTMHGGTLDSPQESPPQNAWGYATNELGSGHVAPHPRAHTRTLLRRTPFWLTQA